MKKTDVATEDSNMGGKEKKDGNMVKVKRSKEDKTLQ